MRSKTLFLNKNACHKKTTLPTYFLLHTKYTKAWYLRVFLYPFQAHTSPLKNSPLLLLDMHNQTHMSLSHHSFKILKPPLHHTGHKFSGVNLRTVRCEAYLQINVHFLTQTYIILQLLPKYRVFDRYLFPLYLRI